jgi:hypothetical protein
MSALWVSNQIQATLEVKVISASSAGIDFTGVDLINIPGGALVVEIFAITGGTGTSTIVLQHSVDNSTWATVPAAAVLNNNTGAVKTASTFSTTGTDQVFAINRELLRRYFRVEITGTTLTQQVGVSTMGLAAITATT